MGSFIDESGLEIKKTGFLVTRSFIHKVLMKKFARQIGNPIGKNKLQTKSDIGENWQSRRAWCLRLNALSSKIPSLTCTIHFTLI